MTRHTGNCWVTRCGCGMRGTKTRGGGGAMLGPSEYRLKDWHDRRAIVSPGKITRCDSARKDRASPEAGSPPQYCRPPIPDRPAHLGAWHNLRFVGSGRVCGRIYEARKQSHYPNKSDKRVFRQNVQITAILYGGAFAHASSASITCPFRERRGNRVRTSWGRKQAEAGKRRQKQPKKACQAWSHIVICRRCPASSVPPFFGLGASSYPAAWSVCSHFTTPPKCSSVWSSGEHKTQTQTLCGWRTPFSVFCALKRRVASLAGSLGRVIFC